MSSTFLQLFHAIINNLTIYSKRCCLLTVPENMFNTTYFYFHKTEITLTRLNLFAYKQKKIFSCNIYMLYVNWDFNFIFEYCSFFLFVFAVIVRLLYEIQISVIFYEDMTKLYFADLIFCFTFVIKYISMIHNLYSNYCTFSMPRMYGLSKQLEKIDIINILSIFLYLCRI